MFFCANYGVFWYKVGFIVSTKLWLIANPPPQKCPQNVPKKDLAYKYYKASRNVSKHFSPRVFFMYFGEEILFRELIWWILAFFWHNFCCYLVQLGGVYGTIRVFLSTHVGHLSTQLSTLVTGP